MALILVLAAAAVAGLSGLPALLARGRPRLGQGCATALLVAASATGLLSAAWALVTGSAVALSGAWAVPGGSFSVSLDALSTWFLLPVFLVPGLGAIFGLQYWRQAEHAEAGGRVQFFYGVLAGGMVLLVVARNSVLFLVGWELMAVAAFFLVATDDVQAETREAAWVYLVATHLGTAALMALFALMRQASGSFDWTPLSAGSLPPAAAAAAFLLALIGFGLKAGLMPLHVWLPSAHASAPSHVSAVMSGVMIKMGLYGLVRVTSLLPAPPLWWGILLLALGALSGVIAAAAALAQHDLKRMLAFSSIENVGLITLGLGLALVGRSVHNAAWIVLGLGGALLHVLNHSLFKSLLFFGAGAVLHATATRRMDALGGLAAAMPVTLTAWLVGALAVSAVPGFNGLPGELMLYLGLFDVVRGGSPAVALVATACIGGLALTGALALASFVRALGAIFLGTARSPVAHAAHEPPGPMTAVLGLLGGLCLAAGLAPFLLAPALEQVVAGWAGAAARGGAAVLGDTAVRSGLGLLELAPLRTLGWAGLAVLVPVALGTAWFLRSAGRISARRTSTAGAALGTWDCGYADPSSPRLQYTSSSFAALLVGLFGWAVALRRSPAAAPAMFPAPWAFATAPIDRLLARLVVPFCQRTAGRCTRVRVLQQGVLHIYLLYILGVLLLGIVWATLSPWSRG